jgi:hypothetical protein
MEQFLPLIINALVGGGGGFLGNLIKKNGLSLIANILSGAVGGSVLPQILSMAGMLAADGGGMDIGSIVSSLVGGGAGSLIAGLLGGKSGNS